MKGSLYTDTEKNSDTVEAWKNFFPVFLITKSRAGISSSSGTLMTFMSGPEGHQWTCLSLPSPLRVSHHPAQDVSSALTCAFSPCPCDSAVWLVSSSPQRCPARPWASLRQAHLQACVPAWPQPLPLQGDSLCLGLGEPPGCLHLSGVMGQDLATRPYPATTRQPLQLPVSGSQRVASPPGTLTLKYFICISLL